ncbi:MAG: hypothetical protein IPJ19_14870 [Planctomycetes bacterium]|nr:hypothetical protein [Planctomycetota bacterium]
MLGACQVLPPPEGARATQGSVRAGTPAEARIVAEALDALAPRVRALIPDARTRPLSVWVQDVPELYWLPRTVMPEADGFYAPGMHRIHLRREAEDLDRTLAHELVHATLGPSWEVLPGTLEEGVCDVLAAQVCPASAARLRAGRLSSASLALGSISLELSGSLPADAAPSGVEIRFLAHLRLDGPASVPVDPLDVFRSSAGLSSAKLSPHVKKALYGLAGMVVQRIVDRSGIAGLHELCLRAARENEDQIPADWILEAAGLDRDPEHWRRALLEGIGPQELAEFVRGHSELATPALLEFLGAGACEASPGLVLARLSACVRLPESGASLDLLSEPAVRASLMRALQHELGKKPGRRASTLPP